MTDKEARPGLRLLGDRSDSAEDEEEVQVGGQPRPTDLPKVPRRQIGNVRNTLAGQKRLSWVWDEKSNWKGIPLQLKKKQGNE